MNAAAETAVGRGNNPFATNQISKTDNALRNQLRMFHHVGGVAHDAGQDQLAIRQLDVLPDGPLVLVANVAGLERIGVAINREHNVDDVAIDCDAYSFEAGNV